MTKEKQLTVITDFFNAKKKVMEKKSADYATEADVLSNFKYAGDIVGISPEKQVLSLIATKVARLGNLLDSGNAPNNESIDDSILDLGCYTDLLYCLRMDKPEFKGIAQDLQGAFKPTPFEPPPHWSEYLPKDN